MARVPAVFLFYENSVKIIVPKVTPGLLGLNIKSEVEEFKFSNYEMANLGLYCIHDKKKTFSPFYEVVIQIELLLLREYLGL